MDSSWNLAVWLIANGYGGLANGECSCTACEALSCTCMREGCEPYVVEDGEAR